MAAANTPCMFSHKLDLSVASYNDIFVENRYLALKSDALRRQGENELKQANSERDFFKAGELRKEAESKISESSNMSARAVREVERISASFSESPAWKQVQACLSAEVCLENCGIDTFVLSRILLIGNFNSVSALNLAGNDIGDIGAFLISDHLSQSASKLDKLDVRNCGLTTDGCIRLVQTLVTVRTLQSLDLRSNGLADDKPVRDAIQAVRTIRSDVEVLY